MRRTELWLRVTADRPSISSFCASPKRDKVRFVRRGPARRRLRSAKEVAGKQHKIADEQNHESAVHVRNREVRVVDDHGDDGHNDRDEKRQPCRRCEIKVRVFPSPKPSSGLNGHFILYCMRWHWRLDEEEPPTLWPTALVSPMLRETRPQWQVQT